ncbi:MAG: sporulation protein YunB [Bacillota bacterium]
MSRKTNLYHRLWYVRKNRRKLHIYIIIVIALIVLMLFISFVENRMKLSLMEISEYRVKSIISRTVSEAVNNNFPDNVDYEEIVIINKDENERINSIQTDVVKLNRIFSRITLEIQNDLSELKDERISIPLGVILGNSLFSAGGPDINVKVIPAGSIETDFRSEFTSAGINQTKHRIYLLVKTNVGIVVPFMEKKSVVTTSIPVAETIIIGEVPDFYMNYGGNGEF